MSEITSHHCRQCGSHDLKFENGRYVCQYCGTVHYSAGARKFFGDMSAFLLKNRKAAAAVAGILFLVVAGFVFILVDRGGGPAGGTGKASGIPVEKGDDPVQADGDAIEPEKKVSAEFTGISPLRDVIGNIYFVGIYRNTGETPVYPRAELALYNAKGEKVAVAKGYGIRGYIMPGEKTPISVLVMKAPAYKTVKYIGIPEAPSYYQPRPKLAISKLKMTSPEHRFDYYRASGRVKNTSGKDAQYVQVAVTAYNQSGRIIGYTSRFLGQTVLKNGDDAPFSVEFHIMKERPARFEVDYSASEYRPRK